MFDDIQKSPSPHLDTNPDHDPHTNQSPKMVNMATLMSMSMIMIEDQVEDPKIIVSFHLMGEQKTSCIYFVNWNLHSSISYIVNFIYRVHVSRTSYIYFFIDLMVRSTPSNHSGPGQPPGQQPRRPLWPVQDSAEVAGNSLWSQLNDFSLITTRVKINYNQNTSSVAHRALTLVKGTSSKILKKTVIFHCKCLDINSYQAQVRALPSHYQNPSVFRML